MCFSGVNFCLGMKQKDDLNNSWLNKEHEKWAGLGGGTSLWFRKLRTCLVMKFPCNSLLWCVCLSLGALCPSLSCVVGLPEASWPIATQQFAISSPHFSPFKAACSLPGVLSQSHWRRGRTCQTTSLESKAKLPSVASHSYHSEFDYLQCIVDILLPFLQLFVHILKIKYLSKVTPKYIFTKSKFFTSFSSSFLIATIR